MKLHVSKGNSKLGSVMNTSFPPVITCRKNAPCAKDGCYAIKFYKMYKTCKTAWDENLELWKSDPEEYFRQLVDAIHNTRYFRYFVSGDIPDEQYVDYMFNTAWENPEVEFLCFTKQYEYVNDYMGDMMELKKTDDPDDVTPPNLHINFSPWEGLEPDNPYNFPVCRVITEDMFVSDDWKICGGNCWECICRGIGCWNLKRGETIGIHKHK